MRPKAVHLTSVHTTFDNRIFHKQCKGLYEKGYEVVLVAQHTHDETRDGVRIRALPKPKNRLLRMTQTIWQTYQIALQENAQIYQFHDPELIPIGILLKLQGKKVVYDIHEDYRKDILSKTWIAKPLRVGIAGFMAAMETLAAHILSGVVIANPPILHRFPQHKTVLVQNFPLLSELGSAESKPYRERENRVLYVGDITTVRGAKGMVEALEQLPATLQTRMTLIGRISEPGLQQDLEARPGYAQVDFVGWKGRAEIGALLSEARVGLSVLLPTPSFLEAYPTKLFEYMLAGIPAVVSDFPFWRELVEEAGCALFVDPTDAKAVAGAVEWLLTHPAEAEAMGARGKQYILSKLNWDREMHKLLGLYADIAPAPAESLGHAR